MPQPHIAAKTVSFKLDVDTRARLENLAEARHRSAHWVMREAITQYVDREEKREAFRQDTIKAWEEYQDTGMHATATEVDNWLASWGTESELPAPVSVHTLRAIHQSVGIARSRPGAQVLP